MKRLLFLALAAFCATPVRADVIYTQPHDGTGTLLASSWVFEEGSDADMYAYDSFIPTSDSIIQEVTWRGGYIYDALYGRVNNFSIYFYESTAGGTEPHVNNPQLPEFYLARYLVGDNAGETPAGVFGGKQMYDYHYTLTSPFAVSANVKLWIRIEGFQSVYPDWGIARGNGPDHSHFKFSTGSAQFNFWPGDENFTLLGIVPEPSALLILGGPLVAHLMRNRKRLHRE